MALQRGAATIVQVHAAAVVLSQSVQGVLAGGGPPGIVQVRSAPECCGLGVPLIAQNPALKF